MILAALLLGACGKHAALSEDVSHLELHTLSGERIALSGASGPVLVNFWSTDCTICLHEMPDLVSLYEDFQHTDFELVAVAMPHDPPNKVLELAEERDLPFPVALDIKGEAVDSFATVVGTPTSYLLDSHGELVERYVGAIPMDDLREKLNRLLEKD